MKGDRHLFRWCLSPFPFPMFRSPHLADDLPVLGLGIGPHLIRPVDENEVSRHGIPPCSPSCCSCGWRRMGPWRSAARLACPWRSAARQRPIGDRTRSFGSYIRPAFIFSLSSSIQRCWKSSYVMNSRSLNASGNGWPVANWPSTSRILSIPNRSMKYLVAELPSR